METTPSLEPIDPDRDLVEAARAGANDAFDRLVTRHQDHVVRLARRILGDPDAALDAAQGAFVKAWRGLGGFQGESRFSTWLTRIVINQCRNELRRRKTVKHTRPVSLDETLPNASATRASLVPDRAPPVESRFAATELREAIDRAMGTLESEAREILVLREVDALSYEEIAQILDVAIGTVRSRLNRARAALRAALAPYGLARTR